MMNMCVCVCAREKAEISICFCFAVRKIAEEWRSTIEALPFGPSHAFNMCHQLLRGGAGHESRPLQCDTCQ